MNESVFGKSMGNVRRHRGVTLLTTDKKEINQYWNLIIIQHIGSQSDCVSNRSEENKGKNE